MATKKATNKSSNPTISVSLRIDPKTKYLIDLLARDQKRTITGVIEWAIERAAAQEQFESDDYNNGPSFRDMIDVLWSTDEAMRLIALAMNKASLLDYDELRIWETIKASPDLWLINNPGSMPKLEMSWINASMVQLYWEPLVDHVQQHRHSPSIRPFSLVEHGVKKEDIDKQKMKAPSDPGAPFKPFDPEMPF
ncbi:hypothetical protein [Vreelandella venusta]|uniref:hypothetical protein n=1 Tax=Vreelandella venusta TaxID=44935 RepID=UPI00200F3118|nr:hypothetical protein [Halomonas venusta]UQI38781.1 hypothetical protein M3L73_11080 [Halomonas venusta]